MPEMQSSALKAEIAAIDADIDAYRGKVQLFDDRISELSLSTYRKDPTAMGRLVQCRDHKAKALDEITVLNNAKAAAEVELRAAQEREAAEARLAASNEALQFADGIESMGGAMDDAIRKFRDSYIELKAKLSAADRKGFGPSAAIAQSALSQALRGVLWRIPELKIEAPHQGVPRSFSSLTTTWADAARGGAKRIMDGPKPRPKPNGKESAVEAALNIGIGKVSGPVDSGVALPGDPPEFEIRRAR
jgi:hypothetical protein